MLVLSRFAGQRIHIGENIVISVNRVVGSRVLLGISAPVEVPIVRAELPPLEDLNSIGVPTKGIRAVASKVAGK